MSQVMMSVLQRQVASLTRQIERLGPENERVRKLLTEYDIRHDLDQIKIDDLRSVLGAIELRTATGEGLDPDETIHIHLIAGGGSEL